MRHLDNYSFTLSLIYTCTSTIPCSLVLFRICRLNERYVVAFEHDPPDLLPRSLLKVHLCRIVHDQVHELVEADDMALDSRIDVLVEPAKDAFPVLQEAKDQIDGLYHHLLDLLAALVSGRHDAVPIA